MRFFAGIKINTANDVGDGSRCLMFSIRCAGNHSSKSLLMVVILQSILINGRGQYNCSLAARFGNSSEVAAQCYFRGDEQCAPEILHVLPNKTYRLRLASSTALSALNLAIEVTCWLTMLFAEVLSIASFMIETAYDHLSA